MAEAANCVTGTGSANKPACSFSASLRREFTSQPPSYSTRPLHVLHSAELGTVACEVSPQHRPTSRKACATPYDDDNRVETTQLQFVLPLLQMLICPPDTGQMTGVELQ
ncbi:hypothetical protein Q8A73_007709 [Channa argus]|nr:hypothetical protein Q8A73_007709 [Channa argus]